MDIIGAVTLGIIWSIMALGVYLTYRILDYADLTVEGSFPMGGAIAAVLITKNVDPYVATFVAILGGMAAGFVTGILHTKFEIPALLSGILSMTALYSINLRIMGKSNISLNKTNNLITQAQKIPLLSSNQNLSALFVGIICLTIVICILWFFFNTEIGFAMRATGDNEVMIRALGSNTDNLKIMGLLLSNGLVALCGALMAQYNGYADIQMGVGTIVSGLAAVIVGEVLIGNKSILTRLFSVVIGSILYRIIITFVLYLGLKATDLRLLYSLLLAIILYIPVAKKKYASNRYRRG